MDSRRKNWNSRQKTLRQILSRPEDHGKAIDLFCEQHAILHSPPISDDDSGSFSEEACQGLLEEHFRIIPAGGEHSIAWILWHIARIEDITMNLILLDQPQVFTQGEWSSLLGTQYRDTGNAMNTAQRHDLSVNIHIPNLLAYRLAVGLKTQENVQLLTPGMLKTRVEASRLQHALDNGDVDVNATWLLDYWGGLTNAGLLLMPPSRHLLVHLNEIMRVRKKLGIKNDLVVG